MTFEILALIATSCVVVAYLVRRWRSAQSTFDTIMDEELS